MKNNLFITSEMKTSDIIIDNPYLMLMLEHFNIDIAIHEKTIEKLCVENEINTDLFLTIANLFNGRKPLQKMEYSAEDIKAIINYLKNSHKYYLDEKYPKIKEYIDQIHQVNNHPEFMMVGKFFDEYFIEVTEHMNYENNVVFPYVLNLNNLINHKNENDKIISYSVTEYKKRHNDIEEKLTDLKNLLIKYFPKQNDQKLRRHLVFCLFELEFDLKIHSKIEDSILIPLVETMENLAKGK